MASLCGKPKADAGDTGACDIIILGLEGSGKTLLTRRLQCLYDRRRALGFTANTSPTTGTEVVDVSASKHAPFSKLRIRELGGSMCPIWPDYFADCSAHVFVVDVSDNASLAPATVELYELLQHPLLKGKPCLVVLNKCDAPIMMSRAEVELVMNLHELERVCEPHLGVLEVSALSGHEMGALMDWMVRCKCRALGVEPPLHYLVVAERREAGAEHADEGELKYAEHALDARNALRAAYTS